MSALCLHHLLRNNERNAAVSASREQTLINRYKAVRAYGVAVETALPNAREVGLAAYVPLQASHDAKIVRCARILRRIEYDLSEI
jgi:hypothetical protein